MKSILPQKNELGFYEMRMESIGGLGANVSGKIIAEAGILEMGLNGASFSSYGSEKKGSPVKAFARFCDVDTVVRVNSPVEKPHLLVIFHETLLNDPTVAMGITDNTTVIVNTKKTPAEMREVLKMHAGTIGCVDALQAAIDAKSRVNTVLLGSISKASGFLAPEAIKAAMDKAFGRKYAAAMPGNLKAFDLGYSEITFETFEADERFPVRPFERLVPRLGYENAPAGGLVTNPGNSILKNNTACRQGYIPVFHKENCINCGECDLTCPDYCFEWEPDTTKSGKKTVTLQRINYQYCKGCLKCVVICKHDALTTELESEYLKEDK